MKRRYRRIAAHWIYSNRKLLPKGILTLESDGTVVSVESCEHPDAHPLTEFHSGVLIPGMVNTHAHLELSHMRGVIPCGGGFSGFARGMRIHRESADAASKAMAASYYDARMWADGISAVADICNSDITFEIKKKSPIEYISFAEAYGLGLNNCDGAQRLAGAGRGRGLDISVTPHSTYSLNRTAFECACNADGEVLSIHFMESRGEKELFRGKGELYKWYRESGMATDFTDIWDSPADRVTGTVPEGKRVMLVHNTFISREDICKLTARFGARLTFVLCPRSNKYITDTLPPVELLRGSGCRIAVGTDSLASNGDLSLIDELKSFDGLPLTELLHWATLAGAEAMGLDDRLGSFEPGKRPGVVLLTGADAAANSLTSGARTKRLA